MDTLLAEAGGKCSRCGYHKNRGALQFHHRDPSKKEFTVSNSKNLGIEKLRAEAAKCDLICGNCHAEIEWPHLNDR
jgi:C4-type Zn-finger protein